MKCFTSERRTATTKTVRETEAEAVAFLVSQTAKRQAKLIGIYKSYKKPFDQHAGLRFGGASCDACS